MLVFGVLSRFGVREGEATAACDYLFSSVKKNARVATSVKLAPLLMREQR